MLVDSHCHLDYLARDGDLDDVLARARTAGLCRLLTIGTKLSSFTEVRAIAERFPEVFCSVGIHPHEAGQEGLSEPDALIELASDPKVVGIGESGLDYYYDRSPRDRQAASFRAHIAAARATDLPVIVHTRDADGDTAAILEEGFSAGAYRGVLHCFTAGPELAARALALGFYVSLAGIFTFKGAEALRKTVREIPIDRLLIETDSPYLAPVPMRGKRNEPAFVMHTAAALAQERGLTVEEIAQVTSENFFRLFDKVPRPAAQDSGRDAATTA